MFSIERIFKKKETVFDLDKGIDVIEADIRKSSKNSKVLADKLCSLAKKTYSKFPELSIKFMIESNELIPVMSKAKWLMFRFYEQDKIEECKRYLDEILSYTFTQNSEIRQFSKIFEDMIELKLVDYKSSLDSDYIEYKKNLEKEFQQYKSIAEDYKTANKETIRKISELEEKKKQFSSQAFILRDDVNRMSTLMQSDTIVTNDFLTLRSKEFCAYSNNHM